MLASRRAHHECAQRLCLIAAVAFTATIASHAHAQYNKVFVLDQTDTIHRYRLDGSEAGSFTSTGGNADLFAMDSGDIDGDGLIDVVILDRVLQEIQVWDSQGVLISVIDPCGSPLPACGPVASVGGDIAVADVDADGVDEIAWLHRDNEPDILGNWVPGVRVLDGTGALLAQFHVGGSNAFNPNIPVALAAGDVGDGGAAEIVVVYTSMHAPTLGYTGPGVRVHSVTGTLISQFPTEFIPSSSLQLRPVDVTMGGSSFANATIYVAGLDAEHISTGAYVGPAPGVHLYDAAGTLFSSWLTKNPGDLGPGHWDVRIDAHDVNSDGITELEVLDKDLRQVRLFPWNGLFLGEFSMGAITPIDLAFDDFQGCSDAGDCTDLIPCNGQEQCDVNGLCQPGPLLNCNTGDECMTDDDEDGLLDVWETFGLDTDCDTWTAGPGYAPSGGGSIDVPLNLLGMSSNHRDILVELDFTTHSARPTQAMVRTAKAVFASGPLALRGVPNPDGRPGINLWVDTGNLTDPLGLEPSNPAGASCRDGIDNDGDGAIDVADRDCTNAFGLEGVGTCTDRIDNDRDGVTDANDIDCQPREQGGGSCQDGVDNDGDGNIDGADADCTVGQETMGGAGSCADGMDNDGNGLIDLLPPPMGPDLSCLLAFNIEGAGTCNDGIDNDSQNGTDLADPACLVGDHFGGGGQEFGLVNLATHDPSGLTSAFYVLRQSFFDPARAPAFHYSIAAVGFDVTVNEMGGIASEGGVGGTQSCRHSLDDEGDGLIDVEDPDCQTCLDGMDNDGDGNIDGADAQCVVHPGGVGEIGGNDFIAFNVGTNPGIAGPDPGTWVHELGHNLNLRHGGTVGGIADHRNCKPHYLSVMNYTYSFGIPQSNISTNIMDATRSNVLGTDTLEFYPPRFGAVRVMPAVTQLTESMLNEGVVMTPGDNMNLLRYTIPGMMITPRTVPMGGEMVGGVRGIDWNVDGMIGGAVGVDSDRFAVACQAANGGISNQAMVAENDWENMVLDFNTFGDSPGGAINPSVESGPHWQSVREQITAERQTDLAVSLVPQPRVDNTATVDIMIANLGNNPARNVFVHAPVPAGLNVLSVGTPTCNTSNPSQLSCLLSYIGAGSQATVTVTFGVDGQQGCLSRQVSASAGQAASKDAAPSDNTGMATISPFVEILAPAETIDRCLASPAPTNLGASAFCDGAPLAISGVVTSAQGTPISGALPFSGTTTELGAGSYVVTWTATGPGASATLEQSVTINADEESLACCSPGQTLLEGNGWGNWLFTFNSDPHCIFGHGGGDSIVSGSGADYLSGGSGSDHLDTSGTTNIVTGGPGNDELELHFGGQGLLYGGPGNDLVYDSVGGTIYGNTGDDYIETDLGPHVIVPGPGRDAVYGGTGDDTVVVYDECELEAFEILSGGFGNDTLITPVSVTELFLRGVSVSGFENIIVTQENRHLSECL